MSDCVNKRLGEKLYAYELGMLTGSDREEFEMHLLECPYCMERAHRFQATARLMRHDPDVREDIHKMAEDEAVTAEAESAEETRLSRRKRRWSALVPATVATLAVALILILKPWHIEVQPTREAVAAANRLAIMYFGNLADHEDAQRLGEIATNLLITDLSESQYVSVVSSQRLYDILKLLGKEGEKKIDIDVASEVAAKARANWLLLGSILQVEPQLVITTQLVDAQSGQVESSQRVTGDVGEDVFSLVDKLTVEIKDDLSLPYAAKQEQDRPIADLTTHSHEAYRNYLEGVALFNRFYFIEAEERFEKVLELDSTFAMAYYYMAHLKDRGLIDKAVQFSDNITQIEKHFIKSREAVYSGDINEAIIQLKRAVELYPEEKRAHLLLGQLTYAQARFEEAVRHTKEAIRIDPLYKSAYNHLAYSYDRVDSLEKAIQAIDIYISLVPDEANPYDSRGDLFASNDMLDEAIESYKQALSIKPDFYDSRRKIGEIYLFRREYAEAESSFQKLASASDTDTRSEGRLLSAILLIHQGKFGRALEALDDCIAADSAELGVLGRSRMATGHFQKMFIHACRKEINRAIEDVQESIRSYSMAHPRDEVSYRGLLAQYLAENGEMARAEQVAEELKVYAEESAFAGYVHMYAVGCIERSKGNLDSAVVSFERGAAEYMNFEISFLLALTFLESGRPDEAVTELEALLSNREYWLPCFGTGYALIPYYLGRANEELNSHAEAIARYEEFLDIWKGADDGIEEIENARQRLARLKALP